MSSTNKTSRLGLCNWLGTDKPEMADFNNDNAIIDNKFSEHLDDAVSHITDEERGVWNSPHYMGVYIGDGATQRTVTSGCPFTPSFMLVFGNGFATTVTDFAATQVKHYFGIATARGATLGLELSGADFIIKSPSDSLSGNERCFLNQLGKTYIYIMVR